MEIKKIYIGGWFQRTTLHFTETWNFLKYGKSNIDFSKKSLELARSALGISNITRENGPLEYIKADTSHGIDFRIYEDGLMILEKEFTSLKEDFASIKNYYDKKLSPGISLIFSKGAPVPKELANIQTILPYIITVNDATDGEVKKIFEDFSEEPYSIVSTKNIGVWRGSGIILINNLRDEDLAREIIESQIFFREFKSQLHRYLDIHRIIWEKIEKIKERGEIKGTEIDVLRNEISDYQKTINLIGSRINQMSSYVRTCQKITDIQKIDEYLNPLFQLKFETLLDTQEYIKHLWDMTKNYLGSAIETFNDLQQKSTKSTIASLQLITTIGVVAGIIGYLGRDTLPRFTFIGAAYFAILMLMTYVLNEIVSRFYKRRKYEVKSQEIKKDIR